MASTTPKLSWYLRRFQAMSAAEIAGHFRKKWRQKLGQETYLQWEPTTEDFSGRRFPILPAREKAPPALLEALKREASEIAAGRWKAFGHLDIQVEQPPRWQKDHLVRRDLESQANSFKLSYRQHPDGADIKLIWEPSRWNQLVRLAQNAWLLRDSHAGELCRTWLLDWASNNPPIRGLNWTSALETGLRLIQFAWIDALLEAAGQGNPEDAAKIVGPHAAYTWRFISFGSSANNHLIGELAGLIAAVARWPSAERNCAPLAELQQRWEREVLLQFAADGGNQEQALGYHQFSWEFCWHAKMALEAAGRAVSHEVIERLAAAGVFYASLKPGVWDFGDSDNAYVTPLFLDETKAAEEWRAWFSGQPGGEALSFWLGAPMRPNVQKFEEQHGWRVYPDSGYAVIDAADWTLRLDLSPLGYLATAAHGHLDALHVSIWRNGVPAVIDPGTGAYYADQTVRNYLASWSAHNGPNPYSISFPERHGAFLWGRPHDLPELTWAGSKAVATLRLPSGTMRREITRQKRGWRVEDESPGTDIGCEGFQVHWQFPPEAELREAGERAFILTLQGGGDILIEVSSGWSKVELFNPNAAQRKSGHRLEDLGDVPLEAVCSPAFRRVAAGPYLLLAGGGPHRRGFWTQFSADEEL